MKTKNTLATGILLICLLPSVAFAQDKEKIYQLTENGRYQFVYVRDLLAGNGVVHPITPRTFYLETRRHGLIAKEVSYTAFLQNTGDDIRAMLEVSQSDLLASVKNVSNELSPGSLNIQQSAVEGFQQVEPSGKELEENTEAVSPDDFDAPAGADYKSPSWIANAVMHPGSEAIPAISKSSKSAEAEGAEDTAYTQVRTTIPWIVQLMLMQDEMPYENWYDGENIPVLTSTEAEKRVRLHTLVQSLLACQDDEIQKEYGRIFPGMNGKIYGGSDAELDELVEALLNLKDEFISSSQPELLEMFSEMETLAMGR